MKACCYYEPVGLPQFGDEERLVEMWKSNWAANGWEPVVLNERLARAHPSWPLFERHLFTMPTTNPPEYERACWARWLAWSVLVQPGELALFADYDVFCNRFTPEAARQAHQPCGLTNLDAANGSGPFIADKGQVDAIPPVLLVISLANRKLYPDLTYWSDMSVWNLIHSWELAWTQRVPICQPLDWDAKAPLIHVSNNACAVVTGHTNKVSVLNKLAAEL